MGIQEDTQSDVREWKRVEEKLWQQAQIMDQIHDSVIATDLNCQITSWNRGAERMLGYTAAEAIGRSTAFIYPEEEQEFLRRQIVEQVHVKGSHQTEVRLITKRGEYIYAHLALSVLKDSAGVITGMIGYSVDITERKRAEEALRESEAQYRDLVEHSQDLICTHDLKGRLLYVNPAAAQALGYETRELLQITMPDLLAPQGRPLFDAYLAQIRRDGSSTGLMRMLTRAGEERIWEYHNTLRTDGVIAPVVRGIAHDVTDKRRVEKALRLSEEKFSKAFRLSPVNISIASLEEGRFLDVNDTLARNTGFTRDEIIGHTIRELGLWAQPDERTTLVDQVKQHGRVQNVEVDVRNKSGETRVALCSAEAINMGGEQCLLVVSQDITNRKRAQEERRRLSGQLLRLQDEARRKMARDLHDSIGQDLVALAATLSQLDASIPSSGRKLRALVSQCRALTDQCLREVRTISYLMHPPMLDEAGLEDAIRHYVDGFAQRTGIRVELEVSSHFARMKPDVELALFRVVQESLTNIQRHSGSAHAKIRLESDSENITLELSDRGSGISRNEPTQNGELPFRPGVGIQSMQERVKFIGGRLDIERSNNGTTVHVTLPVHG
jgi:PAS domain S-box-containing protein